MRLLSALLSVAALAAAGPAAACSVCTGGDPLAAASEQPAKDHALRAALESEYLTVRSASETTPGADTVLDQYGVRVIGVYSPLDALNLALTVPWSMKQLSEDGAGHGHATTRSGLGDVELGARWFLLDVVDFARMLRHGVALSLGTSLPTGSRSASVDEHAQVGTGAVGPWAGVSYRLQADRWTGSASVSGRWRGVNDEGYRYGEALLWSVGGQRKIGSRVAVSAGVDGRLAQRDSLHRGFVENTGGLALLAAPGLHVHAGGGAWLSLRAQLPVYTHLYGDQSIGPTVVAGVQYSVF